MIFTLNKSVLVVNKILLEKKLLYTKYRYTSKYLKAIKGFF